MDEEAMILEELNEGNENLAWFTKNYSKLQKKCSNKFVAIKNKELKVCASNLEEIISLIKKEKKEPSDYLINFIYAEEESLVV